MPLVLIISFATLLPLPWESNEERSAGFKPFIQVQDTYFAHSPVWSPDSKQIAYLCGRSGYRGNCIINSDGGHPIEIVNGGAESSWSPDSKQLVFNIIRQTADGGGNAVGIFVINADGTNLTQITDHGIFPVWSPDGRQILFVGDGSLYLMGVDGSNPRRLANLSPACYMCTIQLPTWSPNGQLIAFFILTDPIKSTAYWIYADGSHLHKLFETISDVAASAWSPDSTRLAAEFNCSGDVNICVLYPTSLKYYKLTDGSSPSWSPDGQKIAFECPLPLPGICTININGSNRQHLTSSNADFGPTWSPDGRRIAFISVKNQIPDIYLINVDGTDQRRLTYSGAGS